MSTVAKSLPCRFPEPQAVVSSGVIGVTLFIVMEVMFFAGLISAYLVLKAGSVVAWPPSGEPRLPLMVTLFNTGLLVFSGFTMHQAIQESRRSQALKMMHALLKTLLLGSFFLIIQGIEWVRLVRYGLTLTSSVYGGTFYTLIGAHALHVFGAIAWLGLLTWQSKRESDLRQVSEKVFLCRMYWWFVVALWPVLFGLVYF